MYLRRSGPRLSVPNEENFLSKEQREADARTAQWKEKQQAMKLQAKLKKVGTDMQVVFRFLHLRLMELVCTVKQLKVL